MPFETPVNGRGRHNAGNAEATREATRESSHGSLDTQQPTLKRLPLATRNRLLSFERRIRLWLLAAGIAVLAPSAILLYGYSHSPAQTISLTALLTAVYAVLADTFYAQIMRPLQTLSNIVAAIREEDYSFRARGARRGDTVGDLALEINALSGALQAQRHAAQDASALLESVLTSMHSPVLAFDQEGRLRLLNPAAKQALALAPHNPIGNLASQLGLGELFSIQDQQLYPPPTAADSQSSPQISSNAFHPPQLWSVRRTSFRLHGLPHSLFVLSDVGAMLREEERLAWQRLIRVLSHEINNSLTPIQSIAGSLRSRIAKQLHTPEPEDRSDFERGLNVIEDRAASLSRFLQAYQRLTHLPPPALRLTEVGQLVRGTAQLETRLRVTIHEGPATAFLCDPDQVQQAIINLLQNAADAALAPQAQAPAHVPAVALSWSITAQEIRFTIQDNGLGVDNPSNLFVPFYTTKPAGSGIGLVLVQQIAAAHAGRVTLVSTPGSRGCTATLILPLAPCTVASTVPPTP